MADREIKKLNKLLTSSHESGSSPNLRVLNRFRKGAYGGILVVFASFGGLNYFKTEWLPWTTPHEHGDFVRLGAFLFATLLLLAGQWVHATRQELGLWLTWLKNPAQKRRVYIAIVSLSIFLGLCLAFAFNIFWISLLTTVYLLLNYWSQWLSNDHLRRALDQTRASTLNEKERYALEVIEHYWLKLPQLARITTLMFCSAISFSLAFAATVKPDPTRQHYIALFTIAAYWILIATILIGEAIIANWRRRRSLALAQGTPTSLRSSAATPVELATTEDKSDIDGLKWFGYSLIPVFFGAGLTITLDGFRADILTFPGTWNFQALLFLVRFAFFCEIFALAIVWVMATLNELRLWKKYLVNPLNKQRVIFLIIGLAFLLGGMLAIVHKVVLITLVISIYFLFNYWTQWESNDQFAAGLEQTRREQAEREEKGQVDPAEKRTLEILEHYWLHLPQLARITTLMFVALIAFSFALSGWMQPHPQQDRFYLIAYTLLVLDILVGEIVIGIWRNKRDTELRNAARLS